MEEQGKGAESLNEKMLDEEKAKSDKQDIANRRNEIIAAVKLPANYSIVSISKSEDIPLGGSLVQEEAYIVEIENKKREREYLILDKDLNEVARVNKDNKIILSEETRKKFKQFIGKEDSQSPEQKKYYDFDEEYLMDEDEKEKMMAKKQKEGKDKNKDKEVESDISKDLKINDTTILSIVEVKDEKTTSAMLRRNFETKNLYLVKLRQDSDNIGSNDWIVVNKTTNGKFEEIEGVEASDTISDMAQELGMRGNMPNETLDAGDVRVVPTNDGRQVEVDAYHLNNDQTIILSVNKENNADVHVYELIQTEKGPMLIPMCAEEHKHEEEISLPEGNETESYDVEKDEEEEARTPWGDAEARRRY